MDKLTDDTKVSWEQECPKKSGSKAAKRYNKYKKAKTVGEALKLGATRCDFSWDSGRGFLKMFDKKGKPVKAPKPASWTLSNAKQVKAEPVDKASSKAQAKTRSAAKTFKKQVKPLQRRVRSAKGKVEAATRDSQGRFKSLKLRACAAKTKADSAKASAKAKAKAAPAVQPSSGANSKARPAAKVSSGATNSKNSAEPAAKASSGVKVKVEPAAHPLSGVKRKAEPAAKTCSGTKDKGDHAAKAPSGAKSNVEPAAKPCSGAKDKAHPGDKASSGDKEKVNPASQTDSRASNSKTNKAPLKQPPSRSEGNRQPTANNLELKSNLQSSNLQSSGSTEASAPEARPVKKQRTNTASSAFPSRASISTSNGSFEARTSPSGTPNNEINNIFAAGGHYGGVAPGANVARYQRHAVDLGQRQQNSIAKHGSRSLEEEAAASAEEAMIALQKAQEAIRRADVAAAALREKEATLMEGKGKGKSKVADDTLAGRQAEQDKMAMPMLWPLQGMTNVKML